MGLTRRIRALAVGGGALLVASALFGSRSADANQRCRPVRGYISVQLAPDGCQSPVGLCTAGKIRHAGVLDGTTSYLALGLSPAAGMPGVVAPNVLSYAGRLSVDTRHGTLQLVDTGVLDQNQNVFTEYDTVAGGTGRFAGATGRLFVSGDITGGGTGFSGRISGRLCRAGH